MRTSGLQLSKRSDGFVDIGYEDYAVDIFDGMDVEVTYTLSMKDFHTLLSALPASGKSDKARLIDAFTVDFDSDAFEAFCRAHGIEYKSTRGSADFR